MVSAAIHSDDNSLNLRYERKERPWLVRRLAPDCSRGELASLPRRVDEERLLFCMGWETANVHLGTRAAVARVQNDLAKRSAGWLFRSAKAMRDAVVSDWKEWRAR